MPNPVRDELTADPRGYGFHATLKPPMRLNHGWFALVEDATAWPPPSPRSPCRHYRWPILAGSSHCAKPGPAPPLQALADVCVTGLDAHRVPPDAAEIARRRRSRLTPEQDAMLLDWGYPHVLGTWRFHMTLTRRLSPDEHAMVRPQAEMHFAAALREPRLVSDICLFTQAGPGAPFMLAERLPLRG